MQTPFETFTDKFQWLADLQSKQTKKFLYDENVHSSCKLYKYSHLERILLDEYLDRDMVSPLCSFQLSNNLILFKKNREDITLYLINSHNLAAEERGLLDIIKLQEKDIEVKEVFGLNDFIELNTRFTDLNFLDFTKRLIDKIEMEEDCLYDMYLNKNEQFLVLVFDMYGDQKSFDLLIKDIKNDVLLPVVIYNTDGKIAFDDFDGVFYTQRDISGRFHKVFRHQIGKSMRNDILIYNEKSENFKLKPTTVIARK